MDEGVRRLLDDGFDLETIRALLLLRRRYVTMWPRWDGFDITDRLVFARWLYLTGRLKP